ncbi:ABC-2 type transporter-domain-containing protein [Delphinella strobiligena]|nr:ABC-2 type transporter-domain-containing protein [Delphinella strobiligena]
MGGAGEATSGLVIQSETGEMDGAREAASGLGIQSETGEMEGAGEAASGLAFQSQTGEMDGAREAASGLGIQSETGEMEGAGEAASGLAFQSQTREMNRAASSRSDESNTRAQMSRQTSYAATTTTTTAAPTAPTTATDEKSFDQHTGIHDSTYYADGIPPTNEKADFIKDGFESAESDDGNKEEIHSLAKRLSRTQTEQSGWTHVPENPFGELDENSTINPNGPNFKPRHWVKSMLKLNQNEPDKNPQRTAGIAFKNLHVYGYGQATDYQKSVGNIFLEGVGLIKSLLGKVKPTKIDILHECEGLVNAGEMLVVLGPPGAGCSTFLKTLTGETHGFHIGEGSSMNYQGISPKEMNSQYRGEAIYTAEVDVHFPNLTVGDTLYFAARARSPRTIPAGVGRKQWAETLRDVVMATFGISETINTKVGNDFIRGVSGGQRKRVTIAEAALSGAPLQAWDNSTRGLDSANAVEFVKTLRMGSEYFGTTSMVAIYQSPQEAYNQFDKVILLYEGRQIFFGSALEGRQYFIDLGYHCPERQTTPDFLTSMTSPTERIARHGWESRVPRTPDEFAAAWKASPQRQVLLRQIDEYNTKYPFEGEALQAFEASRAAQKAKRQRAASPYTLSYGQQIQLCLWRGFKRLVADPSLTLTQILGNSIFALIIGSIFFNLQDGTSSFYSRGALIFFAILMNAFGSALEILTLYAQRPIVEKHARYALYHPSAEAYASMLTDIPYKVGNCIVFNTTLYFLTNLRREPGPFFFFLLISFFLTLVMSMLFRTIASVSRTLSQALAPAAVLILAIVIFTGFVVPVDYMLGWCRWINYIDPVAYGFEALMINEFHDRQFICSQRVPTYGTLEDQSQVCSAVGSVAGSAFVSGDAYINSAYKYYHAHKWRNFGIIIAFMIGFCVTYLASAEFISAKKSKGEVLVFRRGHTPAVLNNNTGDIETSGAGAAVAEKGSKEKDVSEVIQKQTAIFSWENVCYDIKIKGEPRRILDNVDGWVKPGTLTALMGVSGAGKTTLLDCLATRVTMGVITGDMLVDGRPRDASFQRKTGYVQQQDLHLSTSTVREALNFSAVLRQPAHVPREEKLEYVNEVIKLLDMEEYADAVVGVPGEGLNVEQRKRLTIGVELAAKPQLLLFLDEPTSGLDSQTSWAICDLMEKLTKAGQAILCTIHQPSAMLFQRFDRLLFLARGGRTIYFGEVGENSHKLTSYFERNGAHKCPEEANPAEWMLEVIGAAPGSHSDIDWHEVWKASPERQGVKEELQRLKTERPQVTKPSADTNDQTTFREFAAPFTTQLREVTFRVFQQYWRTPSYIYSKFVLGIASALFIGFIFYNAPVTQQGLQNQMFSIFMLFTIFGNLCQQIMPHFVTQRALYEVRERPSKTYDWKAFMLSNIFVEIPWNGLLSLIMFFCFYYPIKLYRNAEAADQVHERGLLFFLFLFEFLIFTCTYADMVIAGMDSAETGGNIAILTFSLTLLFCGVLATPTALPGFWIFMYRVSPFTYLVEGMLSTAVANTAVECAANEYLKFSARNGQTCGEYMTDYIATYGGYLKDNATSTCEYCSIADTNVFLSAVSASYDHRWRDFGIMWAFIIFNICGALFFYWLVRVPKTSRKAKKD